MAAGGGPPMAHGPLVGHRRFSPKVQIVCVDVGLSLLSPPVTFAECRVAPTNNTKVHPSLRAAPSTRFFFFFFFFFPFCVRSGAAVRFDLSHHGRADGADVVEKAELAPRRLQDPRDV